MQTPKPLLLSCNPSRLKLPEEHCCCQRCLATGEVGKEGEKGRRGVAVGLDKQVPTASWEGAVCDLETKHFLFEEKKLKKKKIML